MKKYPNKGCKEAALLKNSRLGARYMLSVYHDSALSNKESPVWNGPPAVGSFAGYSSWMPASVPADSVFLSSMRFPIKLSKAWSSEIPG